jgi:hypothetical protein
VAGKLNWKSWGVMGNVLATQDMSPGIVPIVVRPQNTGKFVGNTGNCVGH